MKKNTRVFLAVFFLCFFQWFLLSPVFCFADSDSALSAERELRIGDPKKDFEANLAKGDLRFIGIVNEHSEVSAPAADAEYMKQFGVWYLDTMQLKENADPEKFRADFVQYATEYNQMLSQRLHEEFDT